MKRIGLLHHPKLPATQPTAERMARAAEAHGLTTWIGSTWDQAAVAAQVADLDLLVTLGGDGSILRAARSAGYCDADALLTHHLRLLQIDQPLT